MTHIRCTGTARNCDCPICNPTPPPSVVDEAERLLEGITPGEWTLRTKKRAPWYGSVLKDGEDDMPIASCVGVEDLLFIAASPRLVRALVAEVRSLRAAVDGLAGVGDDAMACSAQALEQQERAERAEAAYQSTLAALDRVHEREAALNEALGRANLEVARLCAAIEAHRAAAHSGWYWKNNRTLWAALDTPKETTDA